MTKKMWSLLLTGALIAGVFSAVPAHAAPEIPEVANIEDQADDANGHSPVTGQAHPVGVRAADILKVWFTHDAENIYTHVLAATPSQVDSIQFQIYVDPGVGADCLQLRGYTAGANNGAYSRVFADGDCTAVDEKFEEGIVTETNDEDQAIHTITIPRSSSEYFADGTVLSIPNAYTRPNVDGVASSGFFDNTAEGTAYTISAGGAPTQPPVAEEPPGKNETPGQGNQDCSKIKNKKKKKACKKNNGKGVDKDAGCAAYVPGEQGAEAETLTITDAHTAEAPLEITLEHGIGLGGPLVGGVPPDQTSRAYKNLQVDSDAAETGLFIRYEFPVYEDHDLYVNYPDGTQAASVGGFNAVSAGPFDGTGSGGHSEQGAEQIDGLRTPDCGGYTVDFSNYLGEGGEYTALVWLGEIQNDPAAPAKAVK